MGDMQRCAACGNAEQFTRIETIERRTMMFNGCNLHAQDNTLKEELRCGICGERMEITEAHSGGRKPFRITINAQ